MSPSKHSKLPPTIWTIGHSTHPIEEFLGLLTGARIMVVADVRSFPGSRKYPQYGKEALAATLVIRSIGYHWLRALGIFAFRLCIPTHGATFTQSEPMKSHLDWFHIGMRLDLLRKSAALPTTYRGYDACC